MLKSTDIVGRMNQCIADVVQFNEDHGIAHEHAPDLANLMYNCLCLAGEAGEVSNVAKKIWRDGGSPELRAHLEEELVDMVIFICMILKIMSTDFDKAWLKKHEELYDRWKDRKIGRRKTNIIHLKEFQAIIDALSGEVLIGTLPPNLKNITINYHFANEEDKAV